METYELRYFLSVAQNENIHRASEKLRVSPGSLSKAVSRLETELGTRLFRREGRNIKLTEQGHFLSQRASEILQLEESARIAIRGHQGEIHVVIAGAEILLSKYGVSVSETLRKKYKQASFEFHARDEAGAIEEVANGEAHLALITRDPPKTMTSRTLGDSEFVTFVGSGHPLFNAALKGKVVPVEEIQHHGFVGPNHPLLGQVGPKQSFDGWRDDRFPRKVDYLVSSLKILEEILVQGKALAYLPHYFTESLNVKALKISGCPYSCRQTIRMITRDSKSVGWIHQLF